MRTTEGAVLTADRIRVDDVIRIDERHRYHVTGVEERDGVVAVTTSMGGLLTFWHDELVEHVGYTWEA